MFGCGFHMNHAALVELALAYAPARTREGLRVLFALDAQMAETAMALREPVFGQLRLAWWRDEIGRLAENSAAPHDPLLVDLAQHPNLHATALSIVNGWEAWLVTPDDHHAFARQRGGALFGAFGGAEWEEVGTGWSLAEVDPAQALSLLAGLKALRPMPEQRPLAILAYLTWRDLKREREGGPLRQIARALRYAMFGA
jgi:15-cis-phytoene synthase